MILESDVTGPWMILECDIKFMGGAIRTFVRFFEEVEVGSRDGLSIYDHVNPIAQARDVEVIPFAGRFHGVLERFDQIINGARVVVTGGLGIVDGNLNAVETDVFAWTRGEGSGANKNAAVAAGTDLKVEREQKLGPLLGVNEHVMPALVRVEAGFLHGSATGFLVTGHPAVCGLPVEE
jgi:hypothetical protein